MDQPFQRSLTDHPNVNSLNLRVEWLRSEANRDEAAPLHQTQQAHQGSLRTRQLYGQRGDHFAAPVIMVELSAPGGTNGQTFARLSRTT